MDKNYSNLVNNSRNEKLDFNSMCIDSSLEAVADYGTTGHCITPKRPYTNKQTATQPIPVKIPNGEIIMLFYKYTSMFSMILLANESDNIC